MSKSCQRARGEHLGLSNLSETASLCCPSFAEKLRADSSFLPLYRTSDEAIGIGGRRARLFGSRSPALEAILDPIRLEGRRGAENFRSVPAPRAYHECSRSPHGRNQVRALDGERF